MTPFDNFRPAQIYIDVNGLKGPNVWGRDAFSLDINYSGQISESAMRSVWDEASSPSSNKSHPENCNNTSDFDLQYGLGCFNKIVQDGWKMDY